MFIANQCLVEEAKELSKEMVVSGEKTRALSLCESNTPLFVTIESGLVKAEEHIMTDGELFYIGWKK